MQKQADRDLLKDAAITTAQFGVLSVVSNGKDVTQKDVATRLGLTDEYVRELRRRRADVLQRNHRLANKVAPVIQDHERTLKAFLFDTRYHQEILRERKTAYTYISIKF